jgi:ketosteroid isomerase-like protein
MIVMADTVLTSSRSGGPNQKCGGPVHPISGRQFLSVLGGRVRGMPNLTRHQPATDPNDLGRYFVDRANAGDVDGLVALYEPDAVLSFDGTVAIGHAEIRETYERLVAAAPTFEPGAQRDPLISGDLALTSTRLVDGGLTVEIAHRQPDGSWLWAIDQPNVLA